MASDYNKQKLQEKIGEALGLEMAAQKAVEELGSKGLLDKGGIKDKLEKMRIQANNHQTNLEELIQNLSESQGLDSSSIQEVANETAQKASQMMKIYLGDSPDSSEAIEFLCLAEGGEVTNYEVLDAMTTKLVKNREFSAKVKAILEEEQKHLKLCIRLAKQIDGPVDEGIDDDISEEDKKIAEALLIRGYFKVPRLEGLSEENISSELGISKNTLELKLRKIHSKGIKKILGVRDLRIGDVDLSWNTLQNRIRTN
jgi:predicted DNA binding protein